MGGTRRPLLTAASGVAQACTLSGALWALVFDPFIRGTKHGLERIGRGLISACADDLGIVLAALRDIEELF
eukprot:3621383-Pyramimonas_sp.AAC.1